MVTIDNQEVKDLTIDGDLVNEVTMDGIIVWERDLGFWKRRIMVGDNLGGEKVFHDIKSGYFNAFIENDYIDIIESNSIRLIKGSSSASEKELSYIAYEDWGETFIYDYFVSGAYEEISPSPFIISDYSTFPVTTLYDNIHYRHLFIEDPNIRPVEVGDNLSGATLYFTYPDNFGDNYNVTEGDWFIAMPDGDFALSEDEQGIRFRSYWAGEQEDIIYSQSPFVNISKYIITSYGDYIVENLDLSTEDKQNAYNHVLVDITTLGS